jgi:hypothetical protein
MVSLNNSSTDQRLQQEKFVTNCVITLTLTEKSLGNGMQYQTKKCVYLQDLFVTFLEQLAFEEIYPKFHNGPMNMIYQISPVRNILIY